MIRIDFKEVVRDAAAKKSLALHEDDPALLFAGVVNTMLEDLEKSMMEVVEGCRTGNEELARRWRKDAGALAAKMLNAALDAAREAASRTISEGAAKAAAVVHEEMLSAMLRQKADFEDAASVMRRWTLFMLFASGAVLAAAVLSRIL